MIQFDELSEAQQKLVRIICTHQFDSLKRLYDDNAHCEEDITMYLIKYNVTLEEWKEILEDSMDKLNKVHNNPDDLRELRGEDISMFRHTLANIEADYQDKYPRAISNLWQRLFLLEKATTDGHSINIAQFN
jgi:DNA-binding ferritin-like protein (Dps family)